MRDARGWDSDKEYPEYEPIPDKPRGLESFTVICIVPDWDHLQIMSSGRCYTCPMQMIDGESYFRFRGKWHKTRYYTTPNTRVNDM